MYPQTREIKSNGVTTRVPMVARSLIERRQELEEMTDYDPEIYPALWRALGDDYAAIGYSINAERCYARAEYYQSYYNRSIITS